jgi:hypothetical protein
MMQKHIFSALGIAAMACAAWVACDTIDEEDRFVKDDALTAWNFTVDTDTVTVEGETWQVQRAHRLLIEDYTGYLCVNCPEMAEFIENSLVEEIDSLAIVVGMHMEGNQLSTTTGLPFQLSTTEARLYGENLSGWSAANIGLPAVAVDRVKNDGNAVYVGIAESNTRAVANLAQAQYSRYNKKTGADTPNIDLAVNVTPSATEGTYSLSTLVLSDTTSTLNLKLQLWVIEDGISGFQQTSAGAVLYTHNHVFRSSVNGTWGESIALNAMPLAVTHNEVTLNSSWAAANCSVVAFVYRDDTKEVLNAVKVAL